MNPSLQQWIIICRHFIHHGCLFGKDAKPVGKTVRNKKGISIFKTELETLPCSEGGGVGADIKGNIKYGSLQYRYVFTLTRLKMERSEEHTSELQSQSNL